MSHYLFGYYSCSEIPFSKSSYHIGTSQWICIAIHLTVFYMIRVFTERYFRTGYNCSSHTKILETKNAFTNASFLQMYWMMLSFFYSVFFWFYEIFLASLVFPIYSLGGSVCRWSYSSTDALTRAVLNMHVFTNAALIKATALIQMFTQTVTQKL